MASVAPRRRGGSRQRSPRAPALPGLAEEPTGADATREKLLQAAHELLFERAGAEPSVSQISQRAGVQVAMVSYCFGGKTGLLEALIERTSGGVVSELERLAAVDLPPVEKLRRHVAAIIRNFVRFPYANQLSERLGAGDRHAARMAAVFARPTLAFYRDLLGEGVRRGEFREVDPTLLFFSVIGMCEFLFAARSWLGDAGESLDDELIERFTDHTIELVLHGIAAPAT